MSETNDNMNGIINISFDPQRGRCDVRSCEAEQGQSLGTLPRARREGYEFEGWFTSPEGGVRVGTGDFVAFGSDVTLYAHWKKQGESGVISEKRRKRTMLRRQQIAIAVVAAVILLLAVALAVANYIVDIYYYPDFDGETYYIKKDGDGIYGLYSGDGNICYRNDDGYYVTALGTQLSVDGETGEYSVYAVVYTEGSEQVGFSDRVLMFKQLVYDEGATLDKSMIIKSIEIHNEYGSFTFERDNEVDMEFVIKGLEDTAYNPESFAKMAVACGYTLSTQRLESPKKNSDGSIDFAEYGLAPAERFRTETDAEGNTVEVAYDYQPAWYIITSMTGESHKIIVGDRTVDGGGYYARYEGRDTVYILGTNGITDGVLCKLEQLITPLIVYPMGANSYFDVANFIIRADIDHEGIAKYVTEKYGEELEDMTDERFAEVFYEALDANSRKICDFSYSDLEERMNTMYSAVPFISHLEYSAGYYINSNNISSMLYSLYSMDFVEVTKLSPSVDDLKEYGLYEPAFTLEYFYHTTDTKGEDVYVANYVEISAKNADGHYYAYSDTYDMIVCADESAFDFLEWDDVMWYESRYYQLDMSFLTDMMIESPSLSTHFTFENSATGRAEYFAQPGTAYTDKTNKNYKIVKNSSGKFVLTSDGEELLPIYTGDYMVGALVYKAGVNEYEDFAFAEYLESDADGDGENDFVTYYYYYTVKSEGRYILAAQAVSTDLEGNQISGVTTIGGKSYYSSDYFVTKSGYMYLTDDESYMGRQLSAEYLPYGRGAWHTGEVFVTADGKYILVDSADGTWATLESTSSSLYLADRQNSVLARSAVTTLPMYDESGKIIRNAETYYPRSTDKLMYDEELGKMRVFDSDTKAWRNATFDDCMLGIWNTGSYYRLEDGGYLIVNGETGDWGIMDITTTGSANAQVFADGVKLDYTVQYTSTAGKVREADEVYNFRQLYSALLYGSIEGPSELSEEEMAALREKDNFSEAGDGDCILKLTILAKDLSGNERSLVYRFYRYSERKAYMTIEVLDGNDLSASQSENGYGTFYVLNSFVEKLVSDAQKVLDGEFVTSTAKY